MDEHKFGTGLGEKVPTNCGVIDALLGLKYAGKGEGVGDNL